MIIYVHDCIPLVSLLFKKVMGSIGGEGWLFDIMAEGVGASYLGKGTY